MIQEAVRRRLLALLLVLGAGFALHSAQAQLFVGLGYQQGFFNMPEPNVAVDRFNDRGFLFRNLGKFHWPGGEIFSISYRPERLLLELNLNSRRQRISAESFAGSVLQRRDFRFNMQGISLGAGYAVVDEDAFALYLSGAIDVGWMRLSTRLGAKDNINRIDYQLIRRSTLVAGSIYAKFTFRSSRESVSVFSIAPYVHIPTLNFDFTIMNQILNPTEYTLDGTLSAHPLNFGLMVNFDLDLISILQ